MRFAKKKEASSAERSRTGAYWGFGEKVLSGGNFPNSLCKSDFTRCQTDGPDKNTVERKQKNLQIIFEEATRQTLFRGEFLRIFLAALRICGFNRLFFFLVKTNS